MSRTAVIEKASTRRLHDFRSMRPRLSRLVRLLGVRPLASMLQTDASNLAKALSGKRELSPLVAKRVLDLEHVLVRALQIFEPEAAVDWLEGTEPTFGFGRPIDVLLIKGAAPLLEVLDRIESGAYA
jgi:uncharacterized protein (DUF2384 family)